MIRFLIAMLVACLPISQANAQGFPGYPALNYFYVGQGAAGVPQWLAPPAARTAMGLGTMATQNANAVAITGGTATGFPLPTSPPDVATKQYVDTSAQGLTVHAAVNLATTGALPTNNYNNGAAGVGATLTASCASSCAAPTIDGSAATLGMRILVKNEATTPNNGIYTVSQVGTGATPYILTRATDANTPGTQNPNAIGAGTYVLVGAGTANVSTGWVVQSAIVTIGTSPITWAQFSAVSGSVTSVGIAGAAGDISATGTCTITTFGICTLDLSAGRKTLPTHQKFITGSGTYTTPANVLWIELTLVGGGGAGGPGNQPSAGTNGRATCWNTTGAACTSPVYSAGGGAAAAAGPGNAGGAVTGSGTCDWGAAGGGGSGGSGSGTLNGAGGAGGSSSMGGGGLGGQGGAAGGAGGTNTGGGGGGGGVTSSGAGVYGGGGGGAGATCHVIINSPAATYTYVVGIGGAPNPSGAGGAGGGVGGSGVIIVYEHYGS